MVRFIMIARASDALPLCLSFDKADDDEIGAYHREAKLILRRIAAGSVVPSEALPSRGAIRSDNYVYYYLVELGVAFVSFCNSSYPRLLAFHLLLEVEKEFFDTFSHSDVQSAQRPYCLIQFEPYLDKTKWRYLNVRSLKPAEGLSDLSDRLHQLPLFEVTRVLGKDHVTPARRPAASNGASRYGHVNGMGLPPHPSSSSSPSSMNHDRTRETMLGVLATSTSALALALVWLYQQLVVALTLQASTMTYDELELDHHLFPSRPLSYAQLCWSLVLLGVSFGLLRGSSRVLSLALPFALVAALLAVGEALFSYLIQGRAYLSVHYLPIALSVVLLVSAWRLGTGVRQGTKAALAHVD